MKPSTFSVFILLAGTCAAQIVAPPWDILSRRALPSDGGALWRISTSGSVYTANGYAGPNPPITATFGDPSNSSNVFWRSEPNGQVSFSVRIGGIVSTSAMTFDAAGNLYLTGEAAPRGFVPTPGAYKTTPRPYPGPPGTYWPGLGDTSFVCKLRATDGAPIYCTYLDNLMRDARIAVDTTGAVTVLGSGDAITTTAGALNDGAKSITAFKLDPSGARLVYAAAFGATPITYLMDARADASGGVIFAGIANAASPGATSTSFVGRLQPDGAALTFFSTLGANDFASGLAVAPSGAFTVYGTSGARAFLRQYAADGTTILFDQRLDSAAYSSVAYDASGNLVALGSASPALPISHNLHYCSTNGFISRFAPGGSLLERSWLPDANISTLDPTGTWGIGSDYSVATADSAYGLALFQLGPATTDARARALACVTSAIITNDSVVAPGEIIRVLGTQLAATADASPTASRLPTALGGVSITFDGIAAPLLHTAPDSIIAIAPFALPTSGKSRLCLLVGGAAIDCVQARVAAAVAVILRDSNGAAVINQDGSLNSASNPAAPGSVVSLYATGLGALSPAPLDGSILTAPLPAMVNTAAVGFVAAGQRIPYPVPAEILYAGPAPSAFAGVYQVNVRIPATAPAGISRLELSVKADPVVGTLDSVAFIVGAKP